MELPISNYRGRRCGPGGNLFRVRPLLGATCAQWKFLHREVLVRWLDVDYRGHTYHHHDRDGLHSGLAVPTVGVGILALKLIDNQPPDSTPAISTATFSNVVVQRLPWNRRRWPPRRPPRPIPVTGKTANLSVLGSDATGAGKPLLHLDGHVAPVGGQSLAGVQRQRHQRRPKHDGHL